MGKKHPKLQRPKRETILWTDPYSQDSWQAIDAARSEPAYFLCESTGYILCENDLMVRMALTIGYEPDGSICATAQTFTIPKTCIVKRRVK